MPEDRTSAGLKIALARRSAVAKMKAHLRTLDRVDGLREVARIVTDNSTAFGSIKVMRLIESPQGVGRKITCDLVRTSTVPIDPYVRLADLTIAQRHYLVASINRWIGEHS